MKRNLVNTKEMIANLTIGKAVSATKMSMANIVMPSLDSQGLMAYVFPGMVITKEQPNGCLYGSSANTVLRIIGGQLLKGGMADAYAWDASTYAKKAAKTVPIGYGLGATVESVEWANEIVNSVSDPTERKMLIEFLINQNSLRLVFSKEEERKVVEVTQQLYDSGLTYVIDDWMEPDENGLADATILNVGDFLVVTDKGYYCIRKNEFLETHKLR